MVDSAVVTRALDEILDREPTTCFFTCPHRGPDCTEQYCPIIRDCPHKNTVLHTTGSMRFEAGDVVDDQEDHLVCMDCGAVL
jgi:hypothetical protein